MNSSGVGIGTVTAQATTLTTWFSNTNTPPNTSWSWQGLRYGKEHLLPIPVAHPALERSADLQFTTERAQILLEGLTYVVRRLSPELRQDDDRAINVPRQ